MKFLCVSAGEPHPVARELSRQGQDVCAVADLGDVDAALARGAVDVLVLQAEQVASRPSWLASMRERAGGAAPLVLALVAEPSEAGLESLSDAGVDEVLMAPFTEVEVRLRRRLLERRAAERRQLHESEAASRGEMERLSAIIETLSDVTLAGLVLDDVMHLVCERARVLCGADGAAVSQVEGDEAVYRVATGSVARFQGYRMKLQGSLTGVSLERGEVLRSDDTENDVRVNVRSTREVGARSMLCVPLWLEARPVGVLNVLSRRPHAFQDRDVRTLELMAGLLGAAIGNAAEAEARRALIVDRTAVLEALQESQDRFASFMNNSPALAFMKDEEGRRVWVNAPYRRFFGLSEDADVHAIDDTALMPELSVEHVREKDREVLRSGQSMAAEGMIPAPDGTEHYWLTYRFIAHEHAGRRYLGGVALDLTERRRAEGALRRSEENFRALIESSPEALFVHRGGPLVYANPAALAFLELSQDEVSGASLMDLIHPEDRPRVAGRLDAAPGQARPGTWELRFLTRSGRELTAEVGCLGLTFDGQPSLVIRARDLTERREMQARLVVADRLAAVGTLAAGVAHEINNPLSFVISNLSFLGPELKALEREAPSERVAELQEVLREATDGAHRVLKIVRDLKTLSRQDEEASAPVQLRGVLESAITLARGELGMRAQIVRDYRDVPPVEGSEGRFGQVFLNLLINAAQAIPLGAPESHEVRVSLRATEEHVIVEVRDTGVGIPSEVKARIFDPFFTTKPVGEGTGLGLSICHGIVTSFGGQISVESEVGRGSTFRVSLPISRRSGESAPPKDMPPWLHLVG